MSDEWVAPFAAGYVIGALSPVVTLLLHEVWISHYRKHARVAVQRILDDETVALLGGPDDLPMTLRVPVDFDDEQDERPLNILRPDLDPRGFATQEEAADRYEQDRATAREHYTKGGYRGGRPASTMGPPAKVPSGSIRPQPPMDRGWVRGVLDEARQKATVQGWQPSVGGYPAGSKTPEEMQPPPASVSRPRPNLPNPMRDPEPTLWQQVRAWIDGLRGWYR